MYLLAVVRLYRRCTKKNGHRWVRWTIGAVFIKPSFLLNDAGGREQMWSRRGSNWRPAGEAPASRPPERRRVPGWKQMGSSVSSGKRRKTAHRAASPREPFPSWGSGRFTGGTGGRTRAARGREPVIEPRVPRASWVLLANGFLHIYIYVCVCVCARTGSTCSVLFSQHAPSGNSCSNIWSVRLIYSLNHVYFTHI